MAIGIVVALVAGVVALAWLLTPPPLLEKRLPIERPPEAVKQFEVDIRGTFTKFADADDLPKEGIPWSQFRGNRRDNIATGPALAETWLADGPPVRWSIQLGNGYAGAAVAYGRVYVLDYLEDEKADALRCFRLDTGEELWRRAYEMPIKWNHGYSRTVPAIADGKVVTIGPKNHVLCVDAFTGDYLWSVDMEKEYGSETPTWYSAQCPYITDGKVILAPSGSEVMLVARDLQTGETIWQTPNPGNPNAEIGMRNAESKAAPQARERGPRSNGESVPQSAIRNPQSHWKMSHSSVMPMTIDGVPQIVYVALGGALGVLPADGTLLWSTTAWAHNIVAPSPLDLGDGRILITSGHGVGSMLLEVRKDASGKFAATPLRTWTVQELASEQHTPITRNGRLYIVMPKDAGPMRLRMLCFDTKTWNVLWSSTAENRFGLGPYMLVDDKIIILEDDGTLTLARADTPDYQQLATAKVLNGKEAWAPMAFVDGLLILRDWKEMKCLDLRK